MANAELEDALASARELQITIRGRVSGKKISQPVWFVYDKNERTVSLLPTQGSDSSWYKNVLKNPAVEISIEGKSSTLNASPLADMTKAKEIAEKFKEKYTAELVKKFYRKSDVCVEIKLG